eukprot:TRINITY_DN95050_c0_g1_i1.p1 TRINITY_DN95050_c0_g1~~TRINITY_DN95050_c0_g1_i1.p1  ORF type:complete len:526 (-),score=88.75 TRINITY_DN95050_c0_g1_i1:526-2103(-)
MTAPSNRSSFSASSSVDEIENANLPTLPEVVEKLGMGWAQVKIAVLGGCVWFADGAELLLVSSVTKAVSHEWELSRIAQGFVVTVVFLGMLCGNLSSGPLGSYFGRRGMILLSYVGIFIFSILSSLSTSVIEFALWRFVVGLAIGVGQPAWLAISAEITPSYYRMAMGSGTQSFFVFGELYVGLLMVFDDPTLQALHWRTLLQVGAIPSAILGISSFFFLRQSPTFLAMKGRHQEATEVLKYMREQNDAGDVSVDFKLVQVASSHQSDSFSSLMQRQSKVIFGRKMFWPTLVTTYSCFALNLSYYGCLYAFPQVLPGLIKGGAAKQLLLGALWEFPGMALGLAVGLFMWRKTGIKFYLTMVTASLLLFVIAANNHGRHWLMDVLLYTGYYGVKCFPNLGFVLFYQIATEIYPAEARTTGSALCMAGGRAAAMLSPLFYEVLTGKSGHFLYFFLLVAALNVLNLYLVDLLPETAGSVLKDEHFEEISEEEYAKLERARPNMMGKKLGMIIDEAEHKGQTVEDQGMA